MLKLLNQFANDPRSLSSSNDKIPPLDEPSVDEASSVVVSSTTFVTLNTFDLISFVKVGKVCSTMISSPTSLYVGFSLPRVNTLMSFSTLIF